MTMQIVPSGTKVIFRLPGTQGPPGTTDYNELDNLPTLGTAAATDATDYATAAQGALADTAVQPARQVIAGTGLTGGGDLSANRTLAVDFTAVATATQGALADSAVQQSEVGNLLTLAAAIPDTTNGWKVGSGHSGTSGPTSGFSITDGRLSFACNAGGTTRITAVASTDQSLRANAYSEEWVTGYVWIQAGAGETLSAMRAEISTYPAASNTATTFTGSTFEADDSGYVRLHVTAEVPAAAAKMVLSLTRVGGDAATPTVIVGKASLHYGIGGLFTRPGRPVPHTGILSDPLIGVTNWNELTETAEAI